MRVQWPGCNKIPCEVQHVWHLYYLNLIINIFVIVFIRSSSKKRCQIPLILVILSVSQMGFNAILLTLNHVCTDHRPDWCDHAVQIQSREPETVHFQEHQGRTIIIYLLNNTNIEMIHVERDLIVTDVVHFSHTREILQRFKAYTLRIVAPD